MANSVSLIVFPAKDLEKSKKFFSTFLGADPYIDGAWYVGYRVGDVEVGLDPNGKAVIAYTNTDDIHTSIKALADLGGSVVMEPKDVGGGLLVAQVELDGNVLGFRQNPR